MTTALCIHGHFYQPPREDPWFGNIPAETSAAPMRNWNERILRQSYAPIAWARRVDSADRIMDIINCYEWMNFNVGPTLMRWMRDASPETVRRMQEGDARSLARWGHGNAVAQIYHHIIMPLATDEERALETRWAIDDFAFHFGRAPEGMWLPECAVDLPSLDCLAAAGISYVVLAPGQAAAVVRDGKAAPVDENTLNPGEPYLVRLPSGRSITAVFYNGGLSHRVAFDGLARDGELFWSRIAQEAAAASRQDGETPLLTLATDGETYGHHFVFGEMALAFVLSQGYAMRDNVRLTNLASYIAAAPPVREVLIREPSSWSCIHGVERWQSNCGCRDGGHADWNQEWRGPLREALNIMRATVSGHFRSAGAACFTDPSEALAAYGSVLADPAKSDAFAASRFTKKGREKDLAWKLLDMQEQSLAALASCAWFFDDIARIEPENAMSFALRAMELLKECGGPDISRDVLAALEKAVSNQPDEGSGKDIFEREIMSRSGDPATVCLVTWASAVADGRHPGAEVRRDWPKVRVELRPEEDTVDTLKDTGDTLKGTAVIRRSFEKDGRRFSWRLTPFSSLPGETFLPLAEARMLVLPEEAGTTEESARSVKELSRPMLDYLQTLRLENTERALRPTLAAAAVHAASIVLPWKEYQRDVPAAHLWTGLLPYMVAEGMRSGFLDAGTLRQIRDILALHLSPEAGSFAARLARDVLLDALWGSEDGAHENDAALAQQVRGARQLLPDTGWWEVQNEIWARGISRFPLLAAELGFCL
ncbi:MAG: DUF3536 domain-containing protein [Desulfovibrio sp.]|jgi:hypothetical protein|nr:DUF3536 domain-containing protein [Desulfovibrio sp.]